MGGLRTLRDLLDGVPATDRRPAIITVSADGSVATLSRAALAAAVHAAARTLLAAGLGHGEPVIILGPNSAGWIIGCLAVMAADGVPVLLDCQAAAEELKALGKDCGARRVLATGELSGVFPDCRVSLLEELVPPAGTTGPEPHGTVPARAELPALDPAGIAVRFYTSGTTGRPKAVPLSHGNLLYNVRALAATGIAGPEDRLLLPLPLHHAYPFTVGLLGSLASGGALVLPAGVTGPLLLAAIRAAGATILLGVPRLYTALLAGIEAGAGRRPVAGRLFPWLLAASTLLARRTGLRAGRWLFGAVHRQVGPSLRVLVAGGARLDPAVAWRLEGLGFEVLSGYGLTETSPILCFNIRGQVNHESVGRPLAGVKLCIEARSGEAPGAVTGAVPGDVAGEVLARGPGVFAGYPGNEEATREAFTADGWFRTGDVGFLDPAGFLHLVGRVKEIIVLADGQKLVPEEVEPRYAESPLIREVALLEQGGRLAALVVPDEEGIRRRGAARIGRLLKEELEAIALRLPPVQRISDWRITHRPLPRTPMGKLQRFRLPALYAASSGESKAGAGAEVESLSARDQALLATARGGAAWRWLQERFPHRRLELDSSPQLDLGVDSLEWLTLTLEIRDRFGVELDSAALGRMLTVRDLVAAVAGTSPGGEPAADGQAPAHSAQPVAQPVAERGPFLLAFGLLAYGVAGLLMRFLFRLRVEGVEQLPRQGAFLIAPNHASYLDPLALAAALPWRVLLRVRWAGWSAILYRRWYWRLLSRSTGVFPVDPDQGPGAAVATGRAVLGAGAVLVWFPEGRRTLTGEINTFLPGVGLVLDGLGCPVVPVHIDGTFRAWPWNQERPRPAPVTVRIGAPRQRDELVAAGSGDSDAERAADGLRRAVLALGGGPRRRGPA